MKKTYVNTIITGLLFTVSLGMNSTQVYGAKWSKAADGQIVAAESSSSQVTPAVSTLTVTSNEAKQPEDAAITRTRKQIQMLDDLYKTAVVLITEHYVKDPSILSAATASKALFAAMKEKGWHDARLLGLTDVLFNAKENALQDTFEQTAKTKLLAGDASYEEVVSKGGKRYLRMATPIPVVMERCVMCHADFKDNKGVIGAISYTVPLID